jgi:hypothetical protein
VSSLEFLNVEGSEALLPDRAPDELESPAGVRPLRVAAIGGGTGLSTLLRGLCRHVAPPAQRLTPSGRVADLAAIVTVTDDGGSSVEAPSPAKPEIEDEGQPETLIESVARGK